MAHFLLYGPRNTCLGPREARSRSYRMCQVALLCQFSFLRSLLFVIDVPLSAFSHSYSTPTMGGEIECRVRPTVVEIVHAAEVDESLRDERFRSPPVSNTSQTLTRRLMEVIRSPRSEMRLR